MNMTIARLIVLTRRWLINELKREIIAGQQFSDILEANCKDGARVGAPLRIKMPTSVEVKSS